MFKAELFQDGISRLSGPLDPDRPFYVSIIDDVGERQIAILECETLGKLLAAYRETQTKRPHRSADTKRQQVRDELCAVTGDGYNQTDRMVAERLGVSHSFVGNVRREMASERGRTSTEEAYRIGLDGKRRKTQVGCSVSVDAK